jgi:hypothetical protein
VAQEGKPRAKTGRNTQTNGTSDHQGSKPAVAGRAIEYTADESCLVQQETSLVLLFWHLWLTVQNTASRQVRKPILSRGCIYLVCPDTGKRIPLAVSPGLKRFTCASTFWNKKKGRKKKRKEKKRKEKDKKKRNEMKKRRKKKGKK